MRGATGHDVVRSLQTAPCKLLQKYQLGVEPTSIRERTKLNVNSGARSSVDLYDKARHHIALCIKKVVHAMRDLM